MWLSLIAQHTGSHQPPPCSSQPLLSDALCITAPLILLLPRVSASLCGCAVFMLMLIFVSASASAKVSSCLVKNTTKKQVLKMLSLQHRNRNSSWSKLGNRVQTAGLTQLCCVWDWATNESEHILYPRVDRCTTLIRGCGHWLLQILKCCRGGRSGTDWTGLQPCFTQCSQGEFQLFGVHRVKGKESVAVAATRNAYCRTERFF